MSMTGLDIFDHTIEKTNRWLKDMMEELGWEDRRQAYQGLRVTLHALRDRLTMDEAVHLAAQLPLLIRGVYYEGWQPRDTPHKERHLEAFLAPIRAHFRQDPRVDAEAVARAVFKVLAASITAGELEDVQHMLPKALHTLWPAGVR